MLSNWIHCTKNSFFFLKIFWKDGLSKKKSHCNMIFLLLSYFWGKEIPSSIFFPKIWSYSLVGKWKMIFLKKYMEIWYFFQMSWKDGLFERDCAGTWSFWYYLERWYFFPENMIFFPWEEREGRSFSRHTWKYEIFCVHVRFLQTWHCGPLSKKIKDDLIPQKYTRRWLTF